MTRVLSLVGHSDESRLIEATLASHDVTADPAELHHAGGLDLVIVDREALQAWREEIGILRSREAPAAMPVLLMLPARELDASMGMIGQQIDDVMVQPFQPAELLARVNNLLRVRELSVSLRERVAQSDSELRVLGRAFSLFAACNELILRADSEDELLNSTLDELVSNRGFRFAWVGLAKHDECKSIDVLAQSGTAGNYLTHVSPTWGEGPEGDGPAGRAIRNHQAQVCDDMASAPNIAPWRDMVQEYGFGSCLVLPCRFDKTRDGILVLYSEMRHAFTAEEIELMGRLSENIAFGLQALRDREALRQAKHSAELRAYRDVLTGLPNRQWIHEQLATLGAQADRHGRYAAVLFVDLDGFKRINDSMGHEVGDRLLRKVARRLQGLVREEDFVSRQGGDEFVILMPFEKLDTGLEYNEESQHTYLTGAASQVAERIVSGMRKPFTDGHNEHYLGASVGISLFPRDTKEAMALPGLADQAMYEVKSQGGNGYQFYNAQLSAEHSSLVALEQDLYEAVQQQDFELHYQPVVDLETGDVHSVEALLRWPQPDGSTVAPKAFLPMLEETGLIIRVGEWALRKACEDLRKAREHLPDLRLSLNLSVRQLWQPSLPARIADMVRQAGLPPEAVELEVTEAAMMSDIARMEKVLQELQQRGFALTIDDYGTGYSSISRLLALPVSTLKLDGSFLRATEDTPSATSMISAIADMTPKLQLRLVIEGVENNRQRDLLTRLGCSLGQGYLFTHPMPFDGLMAYLKKPLTLETPV
ncbi:EAL domain-containing response regulator [Marinobacter fonticola]|uniref:EAL domain-containing response regulator n=1 Tax=Marinobacter fonticola TaxID=2603215 RepID=UPI0011E77184|nr:EAL domain-containing protein [Marinobacter fonticola]